MHYLEEHELKNNTQYIVMDHEDTVTTAICVFENKGTIKWYPVKFNKYGETTYSKKPLKEDNFRYILDELSDFVDTLRQESSRLNIKIEETYRKSLKEQSKPDTPEIFYIFLTVEDTKGTKIARKTETKIGYGKPPNHLNERDITNSSKKIQMEIETLLDNIHDVGKEPIKKGIPFIEIKKSCTRKKGIPGICKLLKFFRNE